MSTKTVDVELVFPASQTVDVVSCVVEEAISKPTVARVVVSCPAELELGEVSMAEARVDVVVDGATARTWKLLVDGVSFLGVEDSVLRYEIVLRSSFYYQELTQNVRKFRKMSAEDIMKKVLSENGVEHTFELTRQTPRRNFCVQYHESNRGFVERLCEFEGIYYTFTDDDRVVFHDRSSAEPLVDGTSYFELIDAAGSLDHDALGIHEIGVGAAVSTGKVTVNDHDWKKPSTSLLQSKAADRDAELELYEYPSGFRNPGDGQHIAQVKLEALRVPAKTYFGKGNVPSFAPARLFVMGAGAGPEFAGEHLLVKVRHEVVSAAFGKQGARTYENTFEAIPRDVPFRAPHLRPRPTVEGNHTAMVRGPAGEEIHTDKWGRFRAQFHWDREAKGTDDDSRWLRMLQEVGSGMVLARMGWEVNVGYIDGDPDRPLGLARNINGIATPNYGQPAKKTMMTIKTPTYKGAGFNEWRMDDTAGAMTIDVRAQRDLNMHVNNDRSEIIGVDETHTVLSDLQRDVNVSQKLAVGSNVDVKTAKDQVVQVGGNRTVKVGGKETIKIGQGRTETIKSNDSEKVAALRLTIAGKVGVKLPTFDSLKSALVPSPQAALGAIKDGAVKGASGALGGAAGAALQGAASGGSAGAIQGATGVIGGAVGGVAGAAISGAGTGGLMGAAQGALSSAISGVTSGAGGSSGGGAGGAGSFLGSLSSASGVLVGQGASVGGVAQGALQGALGAGKQSLQSMIPSADKIKDALTPKLTMTGGIRRSARSVMSRMVGGAYVMGSLGKISSSIGMVYVETVGGAKITLTPKGAIAQTVAGYHAVTVGGVMTRKSKGSITYTSPVSNVKIAALGKLESEKKFELRGKEITIEGTDLLELVAGATKVVMDTGKMAFEGEVRLDAPNKVQVVGSPTDIDKG
jgi:type VI secretion system secreted protein VgrG